MNLKTRYLRQTLHDWEIHSEACREGIEKGCTETLNAAIEFMRLHGISEEDINEFRDSIMNSIMKI